MDKKFIVLLCLLTQQAMGQSGVYINELGKYGKVIRSEINNGETINKVVKFSSTQEYRYGKWKFYYGNGKLKAQGYFSIVEPTTKRWSEPGRNNYSTESYYEKRTGIWRFWDEKGKERIDLFEDEYPVNGFYRTYTRGQLFQEGDFVDGRLMNGVWNEYIEVKDEFNSATKIVLAKTRYFQDGNCTREEQHYFQ